MCSSRFRNNATNRARQASPTDGAVSQRVKRLIARGEYRDAVDLLRTGGYRGDQRDALGVCLMRLGEVEQAVQLYRHLVLMPGSILERAGTKDSYKRNFATALLMKGLPSGTLSLLHGTSEPDHPAALRIRSAIRNWQRTLPLWRKLEWRLGGIEPPNCRIPLDFEPGEFDPEIVTDQPGFLKPSDNMAA